MFETNGNSLNTNLTIKYEKLPNFSQVGFKHGTRSIPKISSTPIIIHPSNSNDDYIRIQRVIDSLQETPVDEKGVRGEILLKRGVYRVSQTLTISASGIILRGEGSDNNGTTIYSTFTYTNKPSTAILRRIPIIDIISPNATTSQLSPKVKISKNVDVGADKVYLENASFFKKGDTINITKTVNDSWVSHLGMDEYGWTASKFQMTHERIIKDKNQEYITLNIPMVDNLSIDFGGGTVHKISKAKITRFVGVSDVRLISSADADIESQIWSGIQLSETEHCWIKNVGGINLAFSLVNIFHSNYNTIEDCYVVQFKSRPIGDRRYSYYIYGGTGNLIQRCYSDGGRHDFGTGPKVSGPNVFLDCIAVNSTAAVGPHLQWATGTLYDNISAGKIQAIKANNDGTGHGWTGAHNIFWNNKADINYMIQNPPTAVNWLVGSQGRVHDFTDSYTISQSIAVSPRSLYIDQYKVKNGEASLKNVFTDAQLREHTIWNSLVDKYDRHQYADTKTLSQNSF